MVFDTSLSSSAFGKEKKKKKRKKAVKEKKKRGLIDTIESITCSGSSMVSCLAMYTNSLSIVASATLPRYLFIPFRIIILSFLKD